MEKNGDCDVDLEQLLRQVGYSEVVILKIINWYTSDHPEILS